MTTMKKTEIKGARYYILYLGALLLISVFYALTGSKLTGSTSTEKWKPDGVGDHNSHRGGHHHFYHK